MNKLKCHIFLSTKPSVQLFLSDMIQILLMRFNEILLLTFIKTSIFFAIIEIFFSI